MKRIFIACICSVTALVTVVSQAAFATAFVSKEVAASQHLLYSPQSFPASPLPSFRAVGDELNECIVPMAQQYAAVSHGLPPTAVRISRIEQGSSGNSVYLLIIKTGQEESKLILKRYSRSKTFLNEIESASHLRARALPHIKVPKLVYIGECIMPKTPAPIAIFEFLGEQTYKSLLTNATGTQKLSDAARTLGRALAEFHYHGVTQPTSHLASELDDELMNLYSRVRAYLTNDKFGVVDQLDSYIARLFRKARTEVFTHGYMHTDAHLGNFIFLPDDREHIGFIDLAGARHSWADLGHIIGTPGFDYVYLKTGFSSFRDYMAQKDPNIANEKQILAGMSKPFVANVLAEYQRHAPTLPSKFEVEFFTVIKYLVLLDAKYDKTFLSDEQCKHVHQTSKEKCHFTHWIYAELKTLLSASDWGKQ